MVRILDTEVNLEYELGHHLHCLVAQLPLKLHSIMRAAEGGDWIKVSSDRLAEELELHR